MKQTILRLLLVMAVGLSAAACSQDWERPDSDPDAEEVVVTFSISAESGMVRTRSTDETPLESNRKISTGQLIDKVVYALYIKKYDNTQLDENGKPKPTWTGEFELLPQYGDGTPGLGDGQALLPLTGEEGKKNSNLLSKGETLTLRLMRGQEYVIAFWAQNSNCEAYDTKDLEKVVVDYTAGNALAPNNDETRDAFCQVYTFVAEAGKTYEVILKRALAQINIGTAGWDWNAEIEYPNLYAYSRVEMTGLYDQLNVLTEEVSKTAAIENKKIVYDWAELPAYYGENYPTLKREWDEWLKNDETVTEPNWSGWLNDQGNDKEFLWVKLTTETPGSDGDDRFWGNYLKYSTEVPAESESVNTEVFKYLSMCYVLAPTYEGTDGNLNAQAGATIDELTFYLAETKDGNYRPEDKSKKLAPAEARFTINSVPIQRNWRTNILGGTRGTETTLFDPRTVKMKVALCPSYNGEHDYVDNDPETEYQDQTTNK